jgi:N-acetylneuraminic acid mutarotase
MMNFRKYFTGFIGLTLAFLASSCILLAPNINATDSSGNTWSTIARLPIDLFMSTTVVEGKIYVITGNGHINVDHTNTYIYDPVTDTWITKETPKDFLTDSGLDGAVSSAAFNDKIYCFGYGASHAFYRVYDVDSNSWASINPDPHLRHFATANIVNSKIYIIGGNPINQEGVPCGINEVYDPSTNSWSTMATMSEAIYWPISVALENKIYVFGGTHVQIFDPLTNQWKTSVVSMVGNGEANVGAAELVGVYAPKKICLFEGKSTFIFDPETETWNMGANIPESLTDISVAAVNDVIYVVGGVYYRLISSPRTSYYESYRVDYKYVPVGYSSVPLVTDSPKNPSYSLTYTVAGVVVAVCVVSAIGILLFHRKHKPTKTKIQST